MNPAVDTTTNPKPEEILRQAEEAQKKFEAEQEQELQKTLETREGLLATYKDCLQLIMMP